MGPNMTSTYTSLSCPQYSASLIKCPSHLHAQNMNVLCHGLLSVALPSLASATHGQPLSENLNGKFHKIIHAFSTSYHSKQWGEPLRGVCVFVWYVCDMFVCMYVHVCMSVCVCDMCACIQRGCAYGGQKLTLGCLALQLSLPLAFLRLGLFVKLEACHLSQSTTHQAPGSLLQTLFAGSAGLCHHTQQSHEDLNSGSCVCAMVALHMEPSLLPESSPCCCIQCSTCQPL